MLKTQVIPVTPFEQNCSLLWCDQSNEAVLIDPGGDVDILLSEIEKRQLSLQQIWLTHGHLDHVSGTEEIARQLQARIIGPAQEDLFLLENLAEHCEFYNFPIVKSFVPDQWLKEGDKLSLGNEAFEVIQTPGHTPGHIVIIHHASKTLWVGDVLFKNSIGRTDFPRSNHADLIASIKEKVFALPDDYQFISGHGIGGSLEDEKLYNPHLQ